MSTPADGGRTAPAAPPGPLPPQAWSTELLVRGLALFEELLDQPEASRCGLLAERADGDPDLSRLVEWLFEQDAPASRAPGWGDVAEEDPLLGREVGTYRVLELIGQGGLGRVYLAADEAGRRVAIKVLRRELASPGQLTRFAREQSILGVLEHPAIPRLLAAGSASDRAPFLIMEFVEGQPITAYCDAERLDLSRRLQLFRAVCDVVQFAHRHLIAHRDLKPSNILVTAEGEPRLLDFGIAKLLEDETTTRTEQRALTPGCASPEQLAGGRTTVATDVYSLGVVLYELLTGSRPLASTARLPAEIVLQLAAEDLVPPSRSLRPAAAGPSEERRRVAALRRLSSVAQLSHSLEGDLDAIVGRALRYAPEDRYRSVGELAEDVQQFLDGGVVAARRSSTVYRLKKLIRRHPFRLAAAALLLSTLAVGTTLQWMQSRRLREERDRARRVLDLLTASVGQLSPEKTPDDSLSAAALLERSVERLDTELLDQPLARGAVLQAIGRSELGLGRYDRAAELLGQALELRRRHAGSESDEVAETLVALSTTEVRRGRAERAEELARQSLEIRRRVFGAASRPVAESLHAVAAALAERNDYRGAEQLVREALAIHRRDGERSVEATSDLVLLADTLIGQGDLEAAERVARRAVEVSRAVYGEHDVQFAEAVDRVASVLIERGRAAEAEPVARQVEALYGQILGADHPATGRAANQLGIALWRKGDLDGAEIAIRRALAITEEALGPESEDLPTMRQNLALVLEAGGRSVEAEAVTRQAIAALRAAGDDSARLMTAINNLAALRSKLGDDGGAAELYGEALEGFRRLLGDRHPNVAMVLNNLGAILLRRGDLAAAEERFVESLEIVRATAGEESLYAAILQLNLGATAHESGDHEGAERLLRAALALLGRLDPDGASPWTVRGLRQLGETLLEAGRVAEAQTALEESLRLSVRQVGADHLESLECDLGLLGAQALAGEVEAARSALSLLLDRLAGLGTPADELRARTLLALAEIDLQRGAPAVAEQRARLAEQIFSSRLGEPHRRRAEAVSVLGSALVEQGKLRLGRALLGEAVAALRGSQKAGSRRLEEAERRLRSAAGAAAGAGR